MTGCAAVRERAPELALGVLGGAERAEVLLHLGRCARCQALVTELSEVADVLPLLVDEAEPSTGFGRRVVSAMRGRRRRLLLRRAAAVAVTAAAAAIIAVVVVRVVDSGRRTTPIVADVRSAAMIGSQGLHVGRVAVSGHDPAALAVDVDYAVPDGRYTLELHAPGAAPERVGTVEVADGRGMWHGDVTLPAGRGTTVAMVDGDDTVVCSADVPAGASVRSDARS